MCATCGCSGDPRQHHHHHDHDHDHGDGRSSRTVRIERDLLAKNDRLARDNRRIAADRAIAIFNLIGSPGAGKTALLECLVRSLEPTLPVSVLEGDQATDHDRRRIEATGCRAIQINTGAGCHLDASMIKSGLLAIEPRRESVVFVENVGNLVCPALFDLGERAKIVVMSVTEGEDKPLKYPHVFRAADLFVLSKVDLLPQVGLDEARCIAHARRTNPRIEVVRASATTGEGVAAVASWVRAEARRVFRSTLRAEGARA